MVKNQSAFTSSECSHLQNVLSNAAFVEYESIPLVKMNGILSLFFFYHTAKNKQCQVVFFFFSPVKLDNIKIFVFLFLEFPYPFPHPFQYLLWSLPHSPFVLSFWFARPLCTRREKLKHIRRKTRREKTALRE